MYRKLLVICTTMMLGMCAIPFASAGTSQTWHLMNYDADIPEGGHYWMNKTGAGNDDVLIVQQLQESGAKIWVANQSASATVNMGGDWKVNISIEPAGQLPVGGLTVNTTVYVGKINSTTGFHGSGGYNYQSNVITLLSAFWVNLTINVPDTFIISNGEYLAVKIYITTTPAALGNLYIKCTPSSDGNSYSKVSSPITDPGYPVPELSTLVLMTSGLVVGVGMLAYSNKKKRSR